MSNNNGAFLAAYERCIALVAKAIAADAHTCPRDNSRSQGTGPRLRCADEYLMVACCVIGAITGLADEYNSSSSCTEAAAGTQPLLT
jgi:hypothetical protein